jgi:hypothetical protein
VAVFNPNVPEVNPTNFLGWSKAIDQPPPDQTGAILAKGAAELITTGVTGADTLIKKDISEQAHNVIDAERSRYTSDLETALDKANSGKPAPQTDPEEKKLVMEMDADGLPTEIQGLDNNLSTLGSARANGKFSPTAYYGRLDSLAKDLRSRYPGYRDYIDSVFEKYTGVDAANARVKSLMGDLNSYQTQATAERNKWQNVIIQAGREGIPDADKVLEAFQAGRIDGVGIMRWMAPMKRMKADLDLEEQVRKNIQGRRQTDIDHNTDVANNAASTIASNYFNTVQEIGGLNSPQKILDFVRDVQAGKVEASDEQMQLLGQKIMADKTKVSSDIWKELTRSAPGSKSIADVIGHSAAKKLAFEDSVSMYDEIGRLILSKDYGAAFNHMNRAKASVEDTNFKALNDPNIGPYLAWGKSLSGLGEFGKMMYEHFLATSDQLKPSWNEWLKGSSLKMIVQPDLRTEGPVTIKKQIDELDNKKITPPPLVLNEMLDLAGKITDPAANDATKRNLIYSAYHEQNLGLVTRLENRDKVGQEINAFRRLTTFDIAKEVYRVGQKDPDLWPMYKNWVGKTFGNEVMRRDLNDLQSIAMEPTMNIKWDDVNYRLTVQSKSSGISRAVDNIATAKENSIQRKLNNINVGIKAIADIARIEGNNEKNYVDAYVIHTMAGLGFDPSKMKDMKYENPIGHIFKSIYNKIQVINPDDPRRNRPPAGVP